MLCTPSLGRGPALRGNGRHLRAQGSQLALRGGGYFQRRPGAVPTDASELGCSIINTSLLPLQMKLGFGFAGICSEINSIGCAPCQNNHNQCRPPLHACRAQSMLVPTWRPPALWSELEGVG